MDWQEPQNNQPWSRLWSFEILTPQFGQSVVSFIWNLLPSVNFPDPPTRKNYCKIGALIGNMRFLNRRSGINGGHLERQSKDQRKSQGSSDRRENNPRAKSQCPEEKSRVQRVEHCCSQAFAFLLHSAFWSSNVKPRTSNVKPSCSSAHDPTPSVFLLASDFWILASKL